MRRAGVGHRIARLGLALLVLAAAGASEAQEAIVQTSPAPFYTGVPIDVDVVANGFEGSPQPAIDAPSVPGAKLDLLDVSPSVSTNVRILNGKVTQWKRVRFVYRYRLSVAGAGTVELGPFTLRQGSKQASTEPLRLAVKAVPVAGDQRIRLVLPEGPIWVGQQVPVTLEWWVAEEAADRVGNRRARVPLFDRLDAFKFEDPPTTPDRTTTLTVDTSGGPLELHGSVRRVNQGGKPYLVVAFERLLTPLKAGRLTLAPSSIVVEEAVRYSLDLFGDRVPAQVRRLKAQDRPRELVVNAPPLAGRPASYSGAVGRGFSIEVSADRTVVRAGDPIRLSIEIRGDAALDAVALPPLVRSGLDPSEFRVPDGDVAGVVENDTKRFEVSVRVLNAQVREIPPLELSWFDPEQGHYQSARSRPIALSVQPAEVVTARDVVRAPTPAEARAAPAHEERGADAPAPVVSGPAAPSLSGADLALVTDAATLLRPSPTVLARGWAQALAYTGGIAFVGLALLGRRRARRDPERERTRRAMRELRAGMTRAAGAADLARALRALAAHAGTSGLSREQGAELDAVLRACDDIAYAPSTERAAGDPGLQHRALRVADSLLGTLA